MTLAIARERGNDNYELMALLALARALLADPASDRAEIEQIARRGEMLIDANAMGRYRTDLDEIVAQLAATHESETLA